jgi:hypothetical protein
MPTSRTIADIKSKLLHPALTSHFEVKIQKPPGLSGPNGEKYLSDNRVVYNQDKLNLLCSDAILPGSQLATHSISGDFHGATHKHAYKRLYDDRIDLSFYVDAENYLPIRFFEAWIKYISGEQINSAPGRPGTEKSEYFYRMNYPKQYICNQGFEVIKFERTGNGNNYTGKQMVYKFVDVFPLSVNSMSVSYDASSLLKCTVAFSYVRYFISPATADGPPLPSAATGEASSPNYNLTPEQLANINSVVPFNSNIDLSSVTGNIPGGVPFDSAGASQIDFATASTLRII